MTIALPTPTPGHPDLPAMERWRRYAAPLIRLAFRPELQGTENLPVSGPFMLVSNHSGLGLADITSFIVCYLLRRGPHRSLAAMVHPVSFNSWPTGGWMRRLGAIPSTYEAAEAASSRTASRCWCSLVATTRLADPSGKPSRFSSAVGRGS